MDVRVVVLGAGSWGTTVAHLAAHNTPTTLWARRPDVAEEINTHHTNSRYLPGFALHPRLEATADLAAAVGQADVLVMGVPSSGFRETLEEVRRAPAPLGAGGQPGQGPRAGHQLRMTQVIQEVLPGHPYGVLTGPNLAKEILAGHAAAAVIAMSRRDRGRPPPGPVRHRRSSASTRTTTSSAASWAARSRT